MSMLVNETVCMIDLTNYVSMTGTDKIKLSDTIFRQWWLHHTTNSVECPHVGEVRRRTDSHHSHISSVPLVSSSLPHFTCSSINWSQSWPCHTCLNLSLLNIIYLSLSEQSWIEIQNENAIPLSVWLRYIFNLQWWWHMELCRPTRIMSV